MNTAFERTSLSPLTFLQRAATAFGDRPAVVEGRRTTTYREMAERVARFASVLVDRGVAPGDRVALFAGNSQMMLEAHFAIPAVGGVMVPINTRLDPASIEYIVQHSGSSLVLVDGALAPLVEHLGVPVMFSGDLERALESAPVWELADVDEDDLLSINYTSGTTGLPKGVMYEHRGAYLQALSMVAHLGLTPKSVFLWTLPMFHCNGWCFPWAVTAAGGTHVCLAKPEPAVVWRLIHEHRVTHFNAAPTVLSMLARTPNAHPLEGGTIRVGTGGSPPSPSLLGELSELGIEVLHLYGLTESYGPAVVNDWQPQWDGLSTPERAALKARQGVPSVLAGRLRVIDERGCDVPADGVSPGEIVLHGNNVMRGYYNDPAATAAVTFEGGLRTGDLAVLHADGYLEIRDRLKDVIISGGENIASIEVEQVLASHPAVDEVAVVGASDDVWGEVPVAFVTRRDGEHVTGEELIAFARERLAGFKTPKRVVFGSLPKTSTGKIQKFALRQQAEGSGV